MLPSPLKGNRGLCLACSDKIASKYHAHVLHDWIPRYTKDQRQLTETQALRAEISELRTMLDQLTNPER
jgi:hypothetical protein